VGAGVEEDVGVGVEEDGVVDLRGRHGRGRQRWRGQRGTTAARAKEDGGAFRQPGGAFRQPGGGVLRGA